jgi:gas vesicle protein
MPIPEGIYALTHPYIKFIIISNCLSFRAGIEILARRCFMSENRCGDWLKGFLIGGLVGVVVGLLYAPKSGKELREDISEKAKDLADKVKDEYEDVLEKSKKGFESVISRLKELELKAAKKAEEMEKKIGD